MAGRRDLVVIGASAGGVEPLVEVMKQMPPVDAALLAVVHMAANARTALPDIISRRSAIPARLAEDGDAIVPGTLLIAPPDRHLVVRPGSVGVVNGPKENRARPAIDPLFRSAASVYGPRVVAVILSGVLDDGTAGMRAVRQAGGTALVQDPDDALFGGMPRSAIEHAGADLVVPSADIADAIVNLTAEEVAPMEPVDPVTPDLVELGPQELQSATSNGRVSSLTCPECNGALWEVEEGGIGRYRCRVGHAYSRETLVAAQAEQVETALWVALRALEEQAAMLHSLELRVRDSGGASTADSFESRARAVEQRMQAVREVLEGATEPGDVLAG